MQTITFQLIIAQITTNTIREQMKLIKGNKYDTTTLTCTGWTEGDGSGHEGYNVSDYFAADGTYLGADENGIEPLFGNAR